VSITDSTVVDNGGGSDGSGGLRNDGGVLTITTSTVAHNHGIASGPRGGGGGLGHFGGTTRILNSTFAENSVALGFPGPGRKAGGIFLSSGTVAVQHTILARNTFLSGPASECAGPVTSLGHNLIGDPTGCPIAVQGTDRTGDPGVDAFMDDGTPGNGHFPLRPTS
jgi:fibronectin-binding autotransporter adhesin